MTKILVIGGAGFIGSHLVELLVSQGTVNIYEILERVS
jgi:nucleoside-diphosphate-sugar epimerase